MERRFICFRDIFQVRLLMGGSIGAHTVAESYPQGEFANQDEAVSEGERLVGQTGQCWLDTEQGTDSEALVHLDMPQVQGASIFPIIFFSVCTVVCGIMALRFTQLEAKALELSVLDAQEAIGLSGTHVIRPPSWGVLQWMRTALPRSRGDPPSPPFSPSSSAVVSNPVSQVNSRRRHTHGSVLGHIQLAHLPPAAGSPPDRRALSTHARPPGHPPPTAETRQRMQPQRVRSVAAPPPVEFTPPAVQQQPPQQRRPSMVASRQRRLSAMRRGRRRTLELLEAQRIATEVQDDGGGAGEQWR